MCDKEIVEKPLEVTNSLIVVADILGYSELLRKCSNDKNKANVELERLNQALIKALDFLEPSEGKGIVKVFTDNVLLRYSNEREIDCIDLLEQISFYQLTLVLEGYFIRGAFVLGDTYVDEKIAFGYPIVEAYNIESKIAINPRIILSEKLIEKIRYYADHYTTKGNIYTDFLLRDKDGNWFINYLQILVEDREWMDHSRIIDHLMSHKANVEKELESVHPYNVMSKYEWVANYHDFFCQTHYSESEELLINHKEKPIFDFFRI